jgi:hypothetical protein
MKTAELTGALLGYWVAKAEGLAHPKVEGGDCVVEFGYTFRPYDDWAQGGPIIERERINVLEVAEWSEPGVPPDHWRWTASLDNDTGYYGFTGKRQEGPTPLIAAMRAYVASKFGDEVAD